MSIDPSLKRKKDEEAHQIWVGIDPSAKMCRTCAFALPDTEYTVGAEKSNCEIYEAGEEDKPPEVLWDGAGCEWYMEVPDGSDVRNSRE